MDKKVLELLNDQINKEFFSAYLYLDIANYYTEKDLEGFANWYEVQAKEEMDHAMLFYHYIQNNGEKVTFKEVDKPKEKFSDLVTPLKVALRHEQYVTKLINKIYSAAQEASDFRTVEFLSWFIKRSEERR